MRVSVVDKLEVASTKPVGNGFLAVRANIARSGVYKYTRAEIGMTDGNPNELVGVYRSPEFTFDEASLATIAHKPVTINHPKDGVSASNWKMDSVGHSGGAVWEAEDRKHVQVDMLLMDAGGVNASQTTHKQVSLGYSTSIVMDSGISPEGEPYVARMDGGYVCDHIALVPAGRAGHTCRVGDAAWPIEDSATPKTPLKKEYSVKKLVFDGISVSIDDHDAVESGVKKLTDAVTAATAEVASATKALADAEAKAASELAAKDAAIAVKDAEIASLTKAVEDAKVSPEQMREMAKAHAALTDAATKMGFTVTDAMSDAEIKKGAVLARLGDAYADKSEAFFDAAFEIESAKAPASDPYRAAMADRKAADFNVNDAAATALKARQDYIASLNA